MSNNEDLKRQLEEKEKELAEKEREIEKLQKTQLGLYWDKEREPEQVVIERQMILKIKISNLVLLFLLLNLFSNASTNLNLIKSTFKFGTYSEIKSILAAYPLATVSSTKKIDFLKLFDNLINQDNMENKKYTLDLVGFIGKHRLKGKDSYLSKILKSEDNYQLGDLERTAPLLKEVYLAALSLSNKIFFPYTGLVLTNDFFYDQIILTPIVIEYASFVGSQFEEKTKKENIRIQLTNIFTKSTANPVKEAVVKNLSFFKNTKDLAFYQSIIFTGDDSSVIKWLAIVSLTNYTPNGNALKVIKKAAGLNNPQLSSRAIYALSAYPSEETKSIIYQEIKNDNALIRYQAILALKQFKNNKSIDILKYKMEQDHEPSIRKLSKEILMEWRELKEAPKTTNK